MTDRVFSFIGLGGAGLEFTGYDTNTAGPFVAVRPFMVDPALGVPAVVGMPYAEVESLHAALGAWLIDKLVTGAVTERQRWGK